MATIRQSAWRRVSGAAYLGNPGLSYLGESWCSGEPRFPNELVVGYTKHIVDRGGAMTWDVPIQRSGLIPQPFVDQLSTIHGSVGRRR